MTDTMSHSFSFFFCYLEETVSQRKRKELHDEAGITVRRVVRCREGLNSARQVFKQRFFFAFKKIPNSVYII